MSGKLMIGWSEKDITPQKRVKLAGQFYERISEYVETPISVTAMAVESGSDQAVFCSCDLLNVSSEMVEMAREKIKGKAAGLDTGKVIVSATHTHTSILYYKKPLSSGADVLYKYLPEEKKINSHTPDDVMDGKEATQFLAQKISEAVIEAWNNRKSAYMANEFGRAVVGHCRRVVYDDGTSKMWGDTNSANFAELESGNDSGIELLYTFDGDKNLSGVVINIACPSQVVEQRSFISSDYWGKVKLLLREKFGDDLYILGLCGAGGDQCPRDMVRWVDPLTPIDDPNVKRENVIKRKADVSMYDIEGTWEIGKRVSRVVEDRYQSAKDEMKNTAELEHKVFNIDFPVRKVTITEYNEAKKTLEEYVRYSGKEKFDFNDKAYMHVCAGVLERFELQKEHNLYAAEIHVVRLGNIAFTTNPFELFLNYGLQIKARSKAEQTFVIQLACDTGGYLPTKKAEEGGHYSAYVSSGITGHEGGELLVRKTLDVINELGSVK